MGGCTGMAGSGRAVIRFAPGSTVIKTTVYVNKRPGSFVVDTGASAVVLSSQFAKEISLAYDTWPTILVATAGGVKKARAGRLGLVTVQGVKAGQVEGVVADDLSGLQGLLGVSFLSRFTMKMDPQKGVLELTARSPVTP
jgi:aspartyl protease family protein